MILTLGTTPTVQRSMAFRQVVLDDVSRATSVREYASGKSINCARVAHTLGESVLCLGHIGGDRGRQIENDLDAARIAHDFTLVRTNTRLCITVIDESAGTATELIEEAPAVHEGDEAALRLRLREHLDAAQVLVLSGSLAAGISSDFYARCIEEAMARQVSVVIDAKGPALLAAVEQGPLIVKPNRKELGETVGLPTETDNELRAAFKALHDRGAFWSAVTDGRRGTTLSDGENLWHVSTPAVDVVSAIGSGDSFAAGLAVGIGRGMAIHEACAFAAACGSANAMTPFAGHLNPADVERLRTMIEITGLSPL